MIIFSNFKLCFSLALTVLLLVAVAFCSLFFRKKVVFACLQIAILSAGEGVSAYFSGSFKTGATCGVALAFVFVLLLPLLLINRGKREEKKTTVRENNAIKLNRFSPCNVQNVDLSYAFEVLSRLDKTAMSGVERMEIDSIANTLSGFHQKHSLSGEEYRSLNGALARLLQLSANYGYKNVVV